MTSHRPRRTAPRRAAALVEFAFVASITLLFFFAIFEYARFVFLLQVATNAAREGARMASAHTGDGTTTQNIIDEVTARMAGRDKELTSFTVTVQNVNPATGTPIASSSWEKATFANGNAIMVRITGNYKPVLPGLLLTASSIPVQVTATMTSEAN